MPTALCAHCGATFAASAQRRRYCQQACYLTVLRQQAAETLVARFWGKVERNGPIARPELGPCWLWTASTANGYGQFHLRRTEDGRQHTVYAHRYAWALTNGAITDNLSVLHRCDVPLCVRPDHLFLGTQPDNLADARAKGRLIDGRHLIKVSDADVTYIRTHYRPRENGQQLAAQFGVTLVHLLRLVRVGRRPQRVVLERVPSRQVPVLGTLNLGCGLDESLWMTRKLVSHGE